MFFFSNYKKKISNICSNKSINIDKCIKQIHIIREI